MQKDHIETVFYSKGGNSSIQGLPWLIRIEFDREKMIEKEVTLLEIKSKFSNWWEKRHLDVKSIKKDDKKIIQKITSLSVLSNNDNDDIPVIHIRFNIRDTDKYHSVFDIENMNSFIDSSIDKFQLKGISSINSVNNINEERLISFNKLGKFDDQYNEDGNESDNEEEIFSEEYVIYTAGVNLTDIRYLIGIDLDRTISDDINEIYNTFGIEIARAALIQEIINAYERAASQVNYQHVSILVDLMTASGSIMSVDRHGLGKLEIDPLAKSSFEKQVEQFLTAAVFGESDTLKCISSRIMAGLVVNGGTGYPNIQLNTKMLENFECIAEIDGDQLDNIIDGDIVANDIIENTMTDDIFIPS